MGKLAFIFPGQGSQYPGMGKDIAAQYPEAGEIFAQADAALGFNLSGICFHGPEEVLNRTAYTQPAILAVSVACWRVLDAAGIRPDFVAGHSLGEYSALVAAGAIDFPRAVRLVHYRGQWMDAACPEGRGVMAACLGLEAAEVEAACAASRRLGVVQPANFNCPGQIIISGHREAVAEAIEKVRELGGKAVYLAVSGPFHSSLMQPAQEELASRLETTPFASAVIPVVPNVLAYGVTEAAAIREALKAQVTSAVRWEETVRWLLSQGVEEMVEVGPGKVLSGLAKKVDRRLKVSQVGEAESIKDLLASYGEGR
ncbi:MAG: [acyl-carrier-protein] S-malonyltransferase [Clostridia bacterium]|nr:MAG: [acyl-carrier-protein] S-malonyltransferase [Clostridia bacterium]